jgi:hypothetical protein
MIFKLVLKSLAKGKVRFLCAVLGVAAAAGSVAFTFSLTATNDAQAPAVAARLTAPWSAWKIEGIRMMAMRGSVDKNIEGMKKPNRRGKEVASDLTIDLVAMTIDHRPGGRVLQGPPMRAVVAPAKIQNPYANANLEGSWPNENSSENEVVLTHSTMKRFGKGQLPKIGERIKFVGEKGTMVAKIVGYLDYEKLPMGFPGAFVNNRAFNLLEREPHGKLRLWKKMPKDTSGDIQTSESIAPQFKSDAGRNMDRAKPLMLWAAALTALCLLVNSLILSLEARRKELAMLRVIGLTRSGVVKLIFAESIVAAFSGSISGIGVALAALSVYVSTDAGMFPMGMAVSIETIAYILIGTVVICVGALLLTVSKALRLRPLDVTDVPMSALKRRTGMAIAFACGFGAFVAVEVWGSSLMKPFIPSPQWPDAIVSLLPGGASSFDIEKLRSLPGVKRIAELQAMQFNFLPEEPLNKGMSQGRPQYRNALVLASDWLPDFTFLSSDRDTALKAMKEEGACVITEMMARARKLKVGDELSIGVRGVKTPLKIAGVVDLNWHLVTSRALLRGMNRMPVNTDGPVFVTFDTLESIDPRPAPMVRMTHLWLDYEKDFLSEYGVFPAGRKVEASIRDALGNSPDYTVRLHARDEIADGTLAHGANLIGSMARVPFIFLGVLSIGFIALLVASADASKKEFRTLWALGATRQQLVWKLFMEALRPAFAGVLWALPGGALVGWLFTAGTRAAMANWGLPPSFVVPWGIIALGAVGAFVFTVSVALPAAWCCVRRSMLNSKVP